jgi:hypothetical protein
MSSREAHPRQVREERRVKGERRERREEKSAFYKRKRRLCIPFTTSVRLLMGSMHTYKSMDIFEICQDILTTTII